MAALISKLRISELYTDITLQLEDGGTIPAHKLILAIASPVFGEMFYDHLCNLNGIVPIKDVKSSAVRRLVDLIYKTEPEPINRIEYWDLLKAADKLKVGWVAGHCREQLVYFMTSAEELTDIGEVIEHVKFAREEHYNTAPCLYEVGLQIIKDRLEEVLNSRAWVTLPETVIMDVVKDVDLDVTEGELVTGIIKWCRANTKTLQNAIDKFQHSFLSSIFVENIGESEFKKGLELLKMFFPGQLLQKWTFKCQDVTRLAMNKYIVKQTRIYKEDFLAPRYDSNRTIWTTTSNDFEDVSVQVSIYQRLGVSRRNPGQSIFEILLETVHSCTFADRSSITERVSVKMVAMDEDESVVKTLFKPFEDPARSFDEATRSGRPVRRNVFLLSPNKEERLQWKLMEVDVIIDRRPVCHIKAISGETFATTVSSGPTRDYFYQAQSFR